jgi:hypothetical protein
MKALILALLPALDPQEAAGSHAISALEERHHAHFAPPPELG